MCGITGVLNLREQPPVEKEVLLQMLAMLRHRGPDEFGLYRDEKVGLGSARLSIIDLSSGQQPISNEDGSLWIVFNGEIYNYVELRPQLEARGHRFSTHTDTEVILHLYEERGVACLEDLNGQFALAIWDTRRQTLFLARDRLGIRPLFYTVNKGKLIFGSEIKALLAHPAIKASIDRLSLAQIFTYWSTLSPRTIFNDIRELPPAHYLLARQGDYTITPYWSLDYTEPHVSRPEKEYLAEFEELLIDATRIRLRADVPVGAYLSGGLDSAITTAIIRNYTHNQLDTFSIAFEDAEFDESKYQHQMAAFLKTDHRIVYCNYKDIARVFPQVIWHTEIPVLRASPAPMFLLSNLVHQHDLKVVLTGEGADEILAGYNIFKEMKVRRFWAREPDSALRPLLLRRLYPYIPGLRDQMSPYLQAFFKQGLMATDATSYSHILRWTNTSRLQRFLVDGEQITISEQHTPFPLPVPFAGWSPLAQAEYLEMKIFLPQYLLSSQGDRMAMAHSVEGRFPFLDHRVVEFCNRLPSRMKLRGLKEKWLLKQLGRRLVPAEIWQRTKHPYRAPIQRSFFDQVTPDYVAELLSPEALRVAGLFDPAAVERLRRKSQLRARLGEMDEMALVGILSAQLLHHLFVDNFQPASPALSKPLTKLVDRLPPP
ncbi:MAG: asparagine synthase (glutamine-hydrolyzing) [Anaerolineae bacterium]|nr:asparagine synthase (glutamine-hydrolyzing) [Anaerolineae bacterium]